ncbi:unnamed protein product [Sympodiomycopsis kandeliae]
MRSSSFSTVILFIWIALASPVISRNHLVSYDSLDASIGAQKPETAEWSDPRTIRRRLRLSHNAKGQVRGHKYSTKLRASFPSDSIAGAALADSVGRDAKDNDESSRPVREAEKGDFEGSGTTNEKSGADDELTTVTASSSSSDRKTTTDDTLTSATASSTSIDAESTSSTPSPSSDSTSMSQQITRTSKTPPNQETSARSSSTPSPSESMSWSSSATPTDDTNGSSSTSTARSATADEAVVTSFAASRTSPEAQSTTSANEIDTQSHSTSLPGAGSTATSLDSDDTATYIPEYSPSPPSSSPLETEFSQLPEVLPTGVANASLDLDTSAAVPAVTPLESLASAGVSTQSPLVNSLPTAQPLALSLGVSAGLSLASPVASLVSFDIPLGAKQAGQGTAGSQTETDSSPIPTPTTTQTDSGESDSVSSSDQSDHSSTDAASDAGSQSSTQDSTSPMPTTYQPEPTPTDGGNASPAASETESQSSADVPSSTDSPSSKGSSDSQDNAGSASQDGNSGKTGNDDAGQSASDTSSKTSDDGSTTSTQDSTPTNDSPNASPTTPPTEQPPDTSNDDAEHAGQAPDDAAPSPAATPSANPDEGAAQIQTNDQSNPTSVAAEEAAQATSAISSGWVDNAGTPLPTLVPFEGIPSGSPVEAFSSSDSATVDSLPTPVIAPEVTVTTSAYWYAPTSALILEPTETISAEGPEATGEDALSDTMQYPSVIVPDTGVVEKPDGSSTISILFKSNVKWDFVIQSPDTTAQLLAFMPTLLAAATGGEATDTTVLRMQSFIPETSSTDTSSSSLRRRSDDSAGYNANARTLYVAYFPVDRIETLKLAIANQSSEFYTSASTNVAKQLAASVDPSWNITSVAAVQKTVTKSQVKKEKRDKVRNALIGVAAGLTAFLLAFAVYKFHGRKAKAVDEVHIVRSDEMVPGPSDVVSDSSSSLPRTPDTVADADARQPGFPFSEMFEVRQSGPPALSRYSTYIMEGSQASHMECQSQRNSKCNQSALGLFTDPMDPNLTESERIRAEYLVRKDGTTLVTDQDSPAFYTPASFSSSPVVTSRQIFEYSPSVADSRILTASASSMSSPATSVADSFGQTLNRKHSSLNSVNQPRPILKRKGSLASNRSQISRPEMQRNSLLI